MAHISELVITVDLKLLRKQKQSLVRAIKRLDKVNSKRDIKRLDGILDLLNQISDEIDLRLERRKP